jgi:PAS domain S-box-containing protein
MDAKAVGQMARWRCSGKSSIRCINQNPSLVIFMGNDIIDHMHTEEELLKALQAAQARIAQYEQAISMISDIVWRYDANTKGEHIGSYISTAANRMLGLPEGTIGDSFEKYFSYIHPDDLPVMQNILSEGIQTLEKEKTAEYRIRKADGKMLWVRSKGSAYYYPDERVTVFGTTSDITERKRAEEKLRESEEEKVAIMGGLRHVAVEYLDPSLRIIWVNEAVQKSLALSMDDLRGKYCFEIIQGRKEPCPGCSALKAIETGHPLQGELVTPDGKTWISRGTPIKDSDGTVKGIVHVALNITERQLSQADMLHIITHSIIS